jgi:hypothetical protein
MAEQPRALSDISELSTAPSKGHEDLIIRGHLATTTKAPLKGPH